MKLREFNKHLNACRTKDKTRLDIGKINKLTDATKKAMTMFIVRQRRPVLTALITKDIDKSWLHCCGYLYQTKGRESGLEFIHTCEHQIH